MTINWPNTEQPVPCSSHWALCAMGKNSLGTTWQCCGCYSWVSSKFPFLECGSQNPIDIYLPREEGAREDSQPPLTWSTRPLKAPPLWRGNRPPLRAPWFLQFWGVRFWIILNTLCQGRNISNSFISNWSWIQRSHLGSPRLHNVSKKCLQQNRPRAS